MIYRIDIQTVSSSPAVDPVGEAVRHQIAEFGTKVGPIQTSRIFLIDTPASRKQVLRIARELLADPVVEKAALMQRKPSDKGFSRIEIHLKPGVMDPVAASTEMAIRDMGIKVNAVRTGRAYLIKGRVNKNELARIASRVLANGVIESVHFDAYLPAEFATGHPYKFQLKHVRLCDLDTAQLMKLSREGHLFLSLAEMQAIQDYFRKQNREPTDVELETIAQTWSEHCVHKTLKSAVTVEVKDKKGKTLSTRRYANLIKDTIFASTQELINPKSKIRNPKSEFCLSVFKDNAGVIVFDEKDAVCFKVETHNHPSAIEPYGGSATGAGGVIRDVLGTGLAAKPIANTDIFCVADPNWGRKDAVLSSSIRNPKSKIQNLPRGIIHPKRILQQVVAGVRDYGNRMGIPTVNGAVYFDDNYLGNPLVFCGCVGLIPRNKINKQAKNGDAIVVMGGRTGRDGIHGATFSSAELTDTHADEFSHAVQIGNAITEKKMTDVILLARDRRLFTAITDCGAGGLSSAVGEMGEKIGAEVHLDRVPLKYAGLRYDEIWISEAQERMVLSVPPAKIKEVLKLAADEDVEATVIGTFGTPDHQLILHYCGHKVAQMSMHFLHDGIPMPTRKAVVPSLAKPGTRNPKPGTRNFKQNLLKTLSHPNIASKHWIIRQYDHEVQGGSVVKPLTGPCQIGPSDASVLRPKLDSNKGVALGCGMVPTVEDPYWMAIASIDEAIRNVVAVGADPAMTAILDNFCWPSVDDEKTMGTLVRACEACYDAALAYRIPFISGKDSLHNQFTNQETGQVIRIPNTLLISAISVLDDVRKCVTMDFKTPGHKLFLLAAKNPWDLKSLSLTHRLLSAAIRTGLVAACHDVSDGGIAVAAAEMSLASGLGLCANHKVADFAEFPGRYLIELADNNLAPDLRKQLAPAAALTELGDIIQDPKLYLNDNPIVTIPSLVKAWRGTLDW